MANWPDAVRLSAKALRHPNAAPNIALKRLPTLPLPQTSGKTTPSINNRDTLHSNTMIESPCINVCTINPDTGLCEGCKRTLPEIAGWSSFTSAERQKILADLKTRSKERQPG